MLLQYADVGELVEGYKITGRDLSKMEHLIMNDPRYFASLRDAIKQVLSTKQPRVYNKMLFKGECKRNTDVVHMFMLHYPNKVQRLHDNEWYTFSESAPWETLDAEDIFNYIGDKSHRLACYHFSIPEGIQHTRPQEDND